MKNLMLSMAIGAAMLAATPAFADVSPTPAPATTQPAAAPPAPVSTYVPITLDQNDINSLSQYLNALPYGQAAPIIDFLTRKEIEAKTRAGKK